MDIDERASAHHEAGHAVVGVRRRFSLTFVCLTPRPTDHWYDTVPDWGTALGCTKFDPDSRSDAESWIIMTAAGSSAGFLFDPNSVAAKLENPDLEEIDNTVKKEGYDLATRNRLIAEAKEIVGANWDSIKRVAQALVERQYLSGDEVRKLISPSGG